MERSHDRSRPAANGRGMIPAALLPLVVAALIVPIVLAAVAGGTGLAFLVAAIVLLAIVVVTARARPRGAIEVGASGGATRRILLAISEPADDHRTADEVARALRVDEVMLDTEILAVAPTRPGFLERWASDVGAARAEARRKLEVTVASLPDEGRVSARGQVGDADLVVAVEDALRGFAADEVVLVTGRPDRDRAGDRAAAELRERLPIPFAHVLGHA